MGYKDPDRQRAYQREWLARRRAQWFEGRVCVDCGSIERLELDHIDPMTKASHNIWSWSWKRIAEETAKCQVLCRACHEIKSAEELWIIREIGPYIHGQYSCYTSGGCRCEKCRRAQRDYSRMYRARKRVAVD